MGLGAGAFELAKNLLFVVEEVTDETVTVAFVHGKGRFETRAENTWRKSLGQGGDEWLICGGKFDKACEVRSDCIESGNVGKAELAQRVLEHGNAGFGGCG